MSLLLIGPTSSVLIVLIPAGGGEGAGAISMSMLSSLESAECGAYLHPSAVQATSPQLHFPTHASAHFRSWSSFGTNTFRCVRICGTVHSTCAAGEVTVGNDHSSSVSFSGTQCSRPSQICTPSARRRLEKAPAFSVSVRVTVPFPCFTLARKSASSMTSPVGRPVFFVHLVPEGTRMGWDDAASIAKRPRQMWW